MKVTSVPATSVRLSLETLWVRRTWPVTVRMKMTLTQSLPRQISFTLSRLLMKTRLIGINIVKAALPTGFMLTGLKFL